jgi:hypothetical protein
MLFNDSIVQSVIDNTLTTDKIRDATNITDHHTLAVAFLRLASLKSSKEGVNLTSVTKVIDGVKMENLKRTEPFVDEACTSLVANLLAISQANQAIIDKYNADLSVWKTNSKQLGIQQVKKDPNSCATGTAHWSNRSGNCTSDFGVGWIDAGSDFNWRLCGFDGIEWGCKKNDQLLSQETAQYRNEKPELVGIQNLPDVNCLSCQQNIVFTSGNTVDQSSLQQAIQCSIDADSATQSTPSSASSTSPSTNPSIMPTELSATGRLAIFIAIIAVLLILIAIIVFNKR